MKVISDSQVVKHLLATLTKKSILNEYQPALLNALSQYEKNPDIAPERTVRTSNTPGSDTTHLFMPCIAPNSVGVKVISGGPSNSNAGLGFQGSIMILNEFTGALEAVLDGKSLTAFRTGLASTLGLVRIFDPDSISQKMLPELLVFGSGPQAYWHVYLAVKLYGDRIKRVNVISRSSAKTLAEQLRTVVSTPIAAIDVGDEESVRAHVSSSAIVFGCTPSEDGIIHGDYLNADPNYVKFVSVIGSYKPHMIELNLSFIKQNYTGQNVPVLVDCKSHALAEAGELIQGQIQMDQLLSLTELYLGQHKPESLACATGVVWQKLVGLLVMDISMAKHLMTSPEGTEVDFV